MSQTTNPYQTISGGTNRYGIDRPDFNTFRGIGGGLHTDFESTMGDSFSALKAKGMTEGDTKSASLAREAQEVMRQGDVDKMRAMQSSGVTQGMRNLAMRGGAGTGSRERLMSNATKEGMRGMQGIGRDNRMANLGISQADEAMKNQLLGQTGQAEQMIQDKNIGMLSGDITNQNKFNHGIYSEDMTAMGALALADAQRNSGQGQGGGIFGTGVGAGGFDPWNPMASLTGGGAAGWATNPIGSATSAVGSVLSGGK